MAQLRERSRADNAEALTLLVDRGLNVIDDTTAGGSATFSAIGRAARLDAVGELFPAALVEEVEAELARIRR